MQVVSHLSSSLLTVANAHAVLATCFICSPCSSHSADIARAAHSVSSRWLACANAHVALATACGLSRLNRPRLPKRPRHVRKRHIELAQSPLLRTPHGLCCKCPCHVATLALSCKSPLQKLMPCWRGSATGTLTAAAPPLSPSLEVATHAAASVWQMHMLCW